MAVNTLHTPGQNNATGDTLATFKTVHSGLIAHQFQAGLVAAPSIINRAYPRGYKALELKFHDAVDPAYFTPGNDIFDDAGYTGNTALGTKDILLSKRLLKAGVIDDLDRLQADFDAQKEDARAIREGLQRADEKLTYRAILAAAMRNGSGSDEYTNEPDLDDYGTTSGALNTVLTGLSRTAKGDALKETVYLAKETLDQANAPDEGRIMAVRPEVYTLLLSATDKEWINRDWADNNGSLATGKFMMAAGFRVVRSSNIPTTDLTGDGANQAELNLDATNTIGTFYTKEAAVRAMAMNVSYDAWYHKDKRANVYVAEMAAAYGSYRRECAIHWTQTP